MTAATSPNVMRQANAVSVLQAVRRAGPVTRAELARGTGLSKPTVNAIVADLVERGYLVEQGSADAPGRTATGRLRPGPQAGVVAFNAAAGHVAGFDLGVSRIRASLADLSGAVVASAQHDFDGEPPSLDAFADILVGLIEAMRAPPASDLPGLSAAEHAPGLAGAGIWAVGLGLPGFLDRRDGMIQLAPGFERWAGLPFRDILAARFAARFGCPFLAGGRVQFAMLAEHRHGVARGVENAIYLHLGKGVGLGLLLRGEIYEGSEGFAGEVGGAPFDDPEPPPPNVGPFEWAAGGRAFARLARRAVEAGESPALAALSDGDPARLDAPAVFAAAEEGDAAAAHIVEIISDRIAAVMSGVCCVLNPSKLIVGAGLSRAGDAFVAGLAARIAPKVPFPITVERTGLVDRATVLGAIEQALRLVEAERFFLFSDNERALAS